MLVRPWASESWISRANRSLSSSTPGTVLHGGKLGPGAVELEDETAPVLRLGLTAWYPNTVAMTAAAPSTGPMTMAAVNAS